MASPFDFLQGIGKDISGAENAVGGFLKGLLPSQPAQPQNPPLTPPSVSDTPLKGMSPTGGASVSPQNRMGGRMAVASSPQAAQQAQYGQKVMNDQLGALGNEFVKTAGSDLTQSSGAQALAAPFNDPNSAVSQIGSYLPGPGFLIPGSRKAVAQRAGIDPNSWGGKVLDDPFGYIANVLNAGVVSPTQVAANPEMWFAEDNNKDQIGSRMTSPQDPLMLWNNVGPGTGHNYLRDIFAPAVKATTGEDVPVPTTSFEPQAKALTAEANQLEQAQASLQNNPNATQTDYDAYNAKLDAFNAKVQNYQTAYNKSADWWQNSNTSKTLSILGQIATFPGSFAEGMVTFVPQLLQSPEGAALGIYSQVQQGAKFAGDLANPETRDHMTAQELSANLANIAMLGGLIFGAKVAHKGLTSEDPAVRNDILKGVTEHDSSITNPAQGQVAKAQELQQARDIATTKETPQEIKTRIADLQSSLATAQYQLQHETDPVAKRALIEQVSGLTDEVNNLKGQPRQAQSIVAPREYPQGSLEAMLMDSVQKGELTPEAADRRAATKESMTWQPIGKGQQGGRPIEQIRQDIGEERTYEAPPAFTKPVEPMKEPDLKDYKWESDKILGPNYHFLEPRPQDFVLNARQTPVTPADFARLSPTDIRAQLQDTRFKPVKLEKLGGDGWISPDGEGIPISGFDYSAHQEFFNELGLGNDENAMPSRDFMDNGWIKKSTIAGMVNFGIRGLTPQKLDLLNRAIEADMRKGIPPYPYQIADELTGRPAVEVTPQEFAANDFNIAPIISRTQRFELPATQGEQFGTQISGEAGQAGAPSATSEGRDRPEGTPEGTTLTAIIPRPEGQGPLALWKTGAEPTGTVPGGGRTSQLEARKAFLDAAQKAVESAVYDDTLKNTLLRGVKEEVDKIAPEQLKAYIEQRNKEWYNTYLKTYKKYDPEGYVQHLVYDEKMQSDAYFASTVPRAVTYNPSKLLTKSWARFMGRTLYKHIDSVKDELTPDQYKQATDYLDKWTNAKQEELDENTIAEEIAHAYDVDHYFSTDSYYRGVFSSPEWAQISYEAGFGPRAGQPFEGSWADKISKMLSDSKLVNSFDQRVIFESITEYRASALKVYWKAPLAGYTYRVPEVLINEFKDPSLIERAAQAIGRDYETRIRPAIRKWVAAQRQTTWPGEVPVSPSARQGEIAGATPAAVAGPAGSPGLGAAGVANGNAAAPAPVAIGSTGRNAADQESLSAAVKQGPSEKKGFLSPEEWQIMNRTISDEAVSDLHKAGWPEDVRWENFARALMKPGNKEYEQAAAVWEKMPPRSASAFMKAGEMLARESIQTGVVPEPGRLTEPATTKGFQVQQELTPEVPEPAIPTEVNSQQFQMFQKEIAAAEVKLRESGPIIDKMVSSGESQKDINIAKAQQSDMRAYVDALKNGKPPREAVQLGRQAYTTEFNRLNALSRTSSPVPELEEEPYKGVFLGKQYGNFNVDVAKKIIQRLRWSGYDGLRVDKAGNVNFSEFLDGLLSEDRIAEKSYKALPQNYKDYIQSKTGYRGIPKRGPGGKRVAQATPEETGVAPGTENYINQTDFEGLEKAIAVTPQKGGFIAIRHGSTARNGGGALEERLRGWDDVPLDANGEKQAERLAAAFKNVNVSVIYSSPLKRSLDTAYAIAKVTGAKVVVDESLKPLHIGEWANKPAKDFGPRVADLARNRPDEKIPGGESWNEYIRRYLPSVKKHMMDALNQEGITVEVNHTRGVRTLKGHVMAGGEGYDVNMDPLSSKEEVGPGGIMGMKFENGRWTIAGDHVVDPFTGEKKFVSAEASQKFDIPAGTKAVAPETRAAPRKEDPVITAVKQDVKKVQSAESRVAKMKGEIAPKMDLASRLDAVAEDPSHPANASAVEAKVLRDLLPKAEELGGAAYARIKSDYAVALQRFTSQMAKTAKDQPRDAKATAPVIANTKSFEHTAAIASQLRKKIDKGADVNDVAEEAAKKLGMTLKEAQNKMKDEQWGNAETKSWAPAYKDLIFGKAGQVVREARLSNKKLQPTLPINVDEFLGSQKDTPIKVTSPAPRPKTKVTTPAAANIMRRGSSKKAIARDVLGDQILRETPKKVAQNIADHAKKDTKTLRDEVEQIHKEINTPSPGLFDSSQFGKQIAENMSEVRKERRQAGLEEPGMEAPAGGSGGDEPPPKSPGEIFAGWNDAFEPARSHENLKDISNRMDEFLKSLATRVNPGRNTAHPSEQARDINEKAVGDEYRRDGLMKALDQYLGQDVERHRRLRRAIEGPEDARLQAKKLLTPEEASFADMWHSYEEVKGRIKTLPDRELIKSMAEDYLPHVLKFNEMGEELLNKKGKVNTTAMGSTKVKSWINRVVDEETGEVRWPTVDSLIKTFGEKNVEENLVKIFKADTDAFLRKMRTKEMIDDLSGRYISNDEGYKLSSFREREITPGVGGRGLEKGDPPYTGFAIVPEGKGFEKMDPSYKAQLRRINLGPYKSQLRNYWVYKPVAEQLERYANLEEGMEGWNKATNVFQKANAIYKLYKFGYNPMHLYNMHFNMVAMGNKWDPTGISLFSKVFGDTDKLLNNETTWKTPVGEFNGDEAVAKIIDAGAVVRKELVDTASLGEFQELFAKLPLSKQWHNFMWHEVAWKMQIGLVKLKTDQLTRAFERKFGRPVNEAEFNNILQLSTHNAKQAVGFLDKGDMSRNWRMMANTAYFANAWSTLQLRLLGRALPQSAPGAKWLANLGGGERYTNVISAAMKEAGMTPESLKWINSQDAAMARTFAVGGALKLLAMSTALAYGGSYVATLTGQPNARVAGPVENFMRDPTHVFDIYLGTDPATGKDKWQHNPTYGMIQEMMLYGMAAVKAQQQGKSADQVLAAALGRYGFGKANPVLDQVFDQINGRNNALYFQGYGERSNIDQDPGVVALHRALDAKGVPDLGGLEDRLIYAWRSVGPMPSFAPTVRASDQLNTWGDIGNAMGTGQYFGAGDIWNVFDSSSPQFGQWQNLAKFDLGNLAQYVLGSRQATSTTPEQVATNNQIATGVANQAEKDKAEKAMAQAAYKGDWQTVLQIGNQLNMDNNQMLNALEHPPSGSGGGIIYHGLPYQTTAPGSQQDTLQGYTLTQGQTTELESLKKVNTVAMYNDISASPEWQNANGSERAAMISSMESQVMRAVENQYGQQIGLMGGAPITGGDIQSLISTELDLRNQAGGIVATNQNYADADPIQQQRMRTEYTSFADSLAWDATFGNLKGVSPERIQTMLDATINTEEGTRDYLKGSIFYQMGTPQDQTRMLTEYSSLARTMSKQFALGQGAGPRGNIQLEPQQISSTIQQIINTEETAKAMLHGLDYYVSADQATQTALDDKYARLARSMAFSQSQYGDPMAIVNSSLISEESYFDLQNQFGGSNYIKLMAQQLSDQELVLRQGAVLTPSQINGMQRALRAEFLAKNPSYAQYLKAKTWWGKNTPDGQIYKALNNSEYAAVNGLTGAGVSPSDSVLLSGLSSDPYFDPASNMGLEDLNQGSLSTSGVGLGSSYLDTSEQDTSGLQSPLG